MMRRVLRVVLPLALFVAAIAACRVAPVVVDALDAPDGSTHKLGSTSIGGSGPDFGTSAGLVAGTLGIATGSPSESVEVASSTSTENRLKLSSFFETDSAGTAEVLRLYYQNAANQNGNGSKAAIAWFDGNSPAYSKVWAQAHLYLHYYNTYTFLPAAVNTGSSQINVPNYNYAVDCWQVQFSNTGGGLPAPLATSTNYYVKNVDSGHFTVWSESTCAVTQVTITTQGTGTHTVTPNLAYNNNQHQHFSIEVTGADGQTKSTRFSIPYDLNQTEAGFFGSNLSVTGGLIRSVGPAGSNRQFVFANTLSSNLTPDGTEYRWVVEGDSTAESGSNAGTNFQINAYSDTGSSPTNRLFVSRANPYMGIAGNTSPAVALDVGIASASGSTQSVRVNRGTTAQFSSVVWDTAGTDEWSIQTRNDATNDLHFRDSANGRDHIYAHQASGITQLPIGYAESVITKTANYTALATDHNVLVDSTSGAVTITLPTAVTLAGEEFTVKDWKGQAASHAITVATTSSQTIDGATTQTISTAYAGLRMVSDGANWTILGVDTSGGGSSNAEQSIRRTLGTSSSSSTTTIAASGHVDRIDVTVTTPYSATCTLQVGQTGSVALLSSAGDFNLQDTSAVTQTKFVDVMWGASTLAVLSTFSGTCSAGAANLVVHYANGVNP